jgi:hypothetical protein
VDDDEVSADRYEELSGISKSQYEQRLLRAVQQSLPVRPDVADDMGQVESVNLTGEGASTTIVVIFRVANRGPQRLFGWRIAIWPASEPSDPETGTPERYGSLFSVYLDEAINTIPFHERLQPPDADGIEWTEDW